MKFWYVAMALVLVVGVLAGCGGDAAPSTDDTSSGDAASTEEQGMAVQALEESAGSERYISAALDASYEGALPVSSQLALGTLQLVGTENAVTAEQARTLLPLWRAIQGDSLQSQAETNAVLKQIEGAMTAEQLAAIAALQLTFEDMGSWMQEQGLSSGPPVGGTGGRGSFGNLSEEERAAMRATRQAGGEGGFGQGGFGNLSEEERAAMRATAEASGLTFGGGRAGAGRGQLSLVAEPLVELLTQIVGE